MLATEKLPDLPALTVEQAEQWIAAALAHARALRQHDDQLFPSSDDPAAMRAAQQLHGAWTDWAADAESLYERVRPLLASKRYVAGAQDLDHSIGRTRAMLQVTPQDHLRSLDEVRRGEVVGVEEVRRELRDRVQQRGS